VDGNAVTDVRASLILRVDPQREGETARSLWNRIFSVAASFALEPSKAEVSDIFFLKLSPTFAEALRAEGLTPTSTVDTLLTSSARLESLRRMAQHTIETMAIGLAPVRPIPAEMPAESDTTDAAVSTQLIHGML